MSAKTKDAAELAIRSGLFRCGLSGWIFESDWRYSGGGRGKTVLEKRQCDGRMTNGGEAAC